MKGQSRDETAGSNMRRDKREGFALATIGMWLMAVTALSALAVDVGRLAWTATEVQAVADVGATAAVKTATQGGDYAAIAKAAAAKNKADGQLFDVAGHPDFYDLNPIEAGTYDPAKTPPFTPGAAPWNAVRVTATAKQVKFIFGDFFSLLLKTGVVSQAPVTKVATAVCLPPLQNPPDLPITVCGAGAINLHVFQPGEACDPTQLGTVSPLNAIPNTQDACWNDLGTGTTTPSNNDLLALFPPDCGGSVSPTSAVDGETIDVNNGDHHNLFTNLMTCINASPYNGTRRFTIPMVTNCGGCTGTNTIEGFVTLEIMAVNIKTNNGNVSSFGTCNVPCGPGKCPQGIYCAQQVCNPATSGTGIG